MTDILRSQRKDMWSPCGHCPDKVPACSDHCTKPEYLKWRELNRLKREAAVKDAERREADRIAIKQRYRAKH